MAKSKSKSEHEKPITISGKEPDKIVVIGSPEEDLKVEQALGGQVEDLKRPSIINKKPNEIAIGLLTLSSTDEAVKILEAVGRADNVEGSQIKEVQKILSLLDERIKMLLKASGMAYQSFILVEKAQKRADQAELSQKGKIDSARAEKLITFLKGKYVPVLVSDPVVAGVYTLIVVGFGTNELEDMKKDFEKICIQLGLHFVPGPVVTQIA
jgi:hypothetical protein